MALAPPKKQQQVKVARPSKPAKAPALSAAATREPAAAHKLPSWRALATNNSAKPATSQAAPVAHSKSATSKLAPAKSAASVAANSRPAASKATPLTPAPTEEKVPALTAEVKLKVSGDTPDQERASKQDAARSTGLTEGAPGPKSRTALKEEESKANSQASEGRVPTQADASENKPPEQKPALPPPVAAAKPTPTKTPSLQSKPKAAPADPRLPTLRRGRGPPGAAGASRALLAQSKGRALPESVQTAFSTSWGQNFASVVIHTDAVAAEAAASLCADAFAIGEHLYFAAGKFDPRSPEGMALLAHELAHVVQFQSGQLAGVQGISLANSPIEQAADAWVAARGVPEPPATASRSAAVSPELEPELSPAAVHGPLAHAPSAGDDTARARAPPAELTATELTATELTATEPTLEEKLHGTAPPSRARATAALPIAAPVLRLATDGAKGFFSQGYFQQAAGWADASTSLDTDLDADATAAAATFPAPTAALGPAEPAVAPTPAAAPALVVEGEVPAPAAGASEPFTLETDETAAEPALPSLGALSAGADGDTAAAEARLQGAIDQVPTEFEVPTSAGTPPTVELPGAADPAQTAEQETAAAEQAAGLAEQARSAVEQGPGPEQVQPGSVHEEHSVVDPEAGVIEPLGAIPEMDTLQSNPIPDEVKAGTDAENQEQLQATVLEANTSLDTAATDHETARQEEVTKAETEQARVNQEANAEQDQAVSGARADVDAGRSDAVTAQETALADLDTQSAEERTRVEGEVDSRVEEDQNQIEDEYSEAEREAEAEKAAKEQEAQQEKAEADQDSSNDSWWDRALDAVASFFDALLDAINTIFDALVEAIGAIIDAVKEAVIAIVDAIRDFAIALVQAYGEFLKFLVNALLADIFPGLAAALNELIDIVVEAVVAAINWIAEQVKAGILALLDAIGAALNELLEALRAAITAALQIAQAALSGDWAALARMVLEAALNLAGIPPESFYAVAESALGALDTIIADPGAFCGNVINALATGFQNFGSNILTHLQEGFFAWIVGPLGELGITLPSNWDLPGIFGLVMQVLGLTQDGIRLVITEELGETAGVIFDFVWRYVGALIEGGIQGLWEQIQNDLSTLWGMVIDGIKNWLIETVVTQAIIRVATMFNPAGALLNVLVTVYNVIMWLRENAQRIWGVVEAIVGMLAPLAAGDVGPAAAAIEGALASLVPIAISMLANLLGVGGITEKVREVLEGVRETVRGAIRSLIRRVRGLFTGGAETDPEAEEEEEEAAGGDQELGKQVSFSAGGESHRQWIDLQGSDAVVMMASAPGTVASKIAEWQGRVDELPAADQSAATSALGSASGALATTEAAADALAPIAASNAATPPEGGAPPLEDSAVESDQDQLKQALIGVIEAMGGEGEPFQPVTVPATMSGGSESVEVQVSGDHLAVSVAGGDPGQKLSAISAFIASARNGAGATLVNGAKTAIDTAANAITAIVATGGRVTADDAATVQTKAQEIATQVAAVGTGMGIDSLARGMRLDPIPQVARTFTRLVAENDTFQSKFDTEFDRQLLNQQNGLNQLSIDAWIVNFDAYGLDEQSFLALDASARAAVLTELKRRAQQKIDTPRVQKQKWQDALNALNAVDPNDPLAVPDFSKLAIVSGRFDNLSQVWRENRALIGQLVQAGNTMWSGIDSRFAILHNADQIAGGSGQINEFDPDPPTLSSPTPTPAEEAAWSAYVTHMQTLVGPANVNSSIGSQWKQQIEGLRDDITNGRQPPSWAIWKLNLALRPQ